MVRLQDSKSLKISLIYFMFFRYICKRPPNRPPNLFAARNLSRPSRPFRVAAQCPSTPSKPYRIRFEYFQSAPSAVDRCGATCPWGGAAIRHSLPRHKACAAIGVAFQTGGRATPCAESYSPAAKPRVMRSGRTHRVDITCRNARCDRGRPSTSAARHNAAR